MDSALRTEPGTSQSQTVSASLRHSLVRCLGSRLLTNHRTPTSALPWTHLLPESQAVGLWKLPGTTPALPTTRPASKGHPNVSNSQRVPCCFQPTQPRVLADSQGSTWRALPRFPDPTGAELSSPACAPRASIGAPLALRPALSPPCPTEPGLAHCPCWVPSAQPRAPHASLSNK